MRGMSVAKTLTIDLTPETVRLVQEAVRSGEYPDASAVIDAALQGWNAQRDDLLGYSMEELRQLGDEGEVSGPGTMTLDDIQREGFRRAEASNAGL